MFGCLLFLLSIILAQGTNCPDRAALNKVDVWVHANYSDKGQHLKSININLLDAYKMIDVVKANVTVLCDGMIKMFPKLEQLSLVDVNLSEIHSEAFQNVPRLTHLSLSVNNLKKVTRDNFRNLPNLKVLFLSSNRIEEIERDAFFDLTNLGKIYLDRNKLYEIDNDWFVQMPNLNLIDLSFNKISKLQNGVFSLPKRKLIKIRLQSNEIEEIEGGAFVPMGSENEQPTLNLDLTNNHLVNIEEVLLSRLSEFPTELKLNSNRIKCITLEKLKFLQVATFRLDLLDNPIDCACLEDINKAITKGELKNFDFTSTNDCFGIPHESNRPSW